MTNKIVVVVKGIILNNGKLLTVKRSEKENKGAGNWELAGGKLDFGEDLEIGLLREIKEETGLTVEIDKVLYAKSYQKKKTRQDFVLTYLCFTNEKDVVLSEEHSNYKWITQKESRSILTKEIINNFEKNDIFSLKKWI